MLSWTEHEILTAHKTKNVAKIKNFRAFNLSDVVFAMLINVKMPTIFVHFNIYEPDKSHAQLSWA